MEFVFPVHPSIQGVSMLSRGVTVIRDLAHLKVIGEQIKAGAGGDDPIDLYTKTKMEADRMARLEGFSEKDKLEILSREGHAAIYMNGMLISLVMSHDAHHNHAWHLSMCRISGPGQYAKVPEMYMDLVCNAFFSEWKSIPNPGMMTSVTHFVGND